MSSNIRFDRLLELAQHLETGKLGHEVFDFDSWNGFLDLDGNLEEEPVPHQCGTMGCAVGEAPILWPEDWHFDFEAHPSLIKSGDGGYALTDAVEWFGLTSNAVNHLFQPNQQKPTVFGGNILDKNATKEQVASNIRAFVAKMQAETEKGGSDGK